jgi:hypothetical protein
MAAAARRPARRPRRPGRPRTVGPGHRGVHDRRQPAAAVDGGGRDPAGGGPAGRAPAGCVVSAAPRPGPAPSAPTWSAFGGPGEVPKQRLAHMSAGLGLLPGAVIDQHFSQRNRLGRLLLLVPRSPQPGRHRDRRGHRTRDRPRRRARGAGQGAVTVVDGYRAQSDAFEVRARGRCWCRAWSCIPCRRLPASTSAPGSCCRLQALATRERLAARGGRGVAAGRRPGGAAPAPARSRRHPQ